MKYSRPLIAATLAVVAAGAGGLAYAGGGQDGPQWQDCEAEGMEALECATVEVPVDWRDPDGSTMDIAISRHAAQDPERRLGVLAVNPGGPGASGLAMPAQASNFLADDVIERFDIVGFDPRGVGESQGVECSVDLATIIPRNAAEYDELLDDRRGQAEQCDRDNPLLPHIDTVSAARDIDAIRAKLGEESISYFAGSYGTQLGATYAELFGERLRGMALDAMAEHTVDQGQLATEQAEASDKAFARFAEWCHGEVDCAPGVDDVGAAWDQLVADADAEPLPAPEAPEGAPETVDGAAIVDASAALLASKDLTWPQLAEATAAGVEERDGSGFAAMLAGDGMVGAMVGIRCLDWPADEANRDFEHVSAAAKQAASEAPRFGAHAQWYYRPECLEWQHAAVNSPDEWNITQGPPIQIVGGLNDPKTAYESARRAADQISRAELLTYTGDGHFSSMTSQCVRDKVGDYLITPQSGAVETQCDD